MKKLITLVSLLFLSISITAQLQSHNHAVLWQGFTHQWTYNHRCNRIGDFVQFNNGNPLHTHTSATGIGPDSTFYSANFTILESPDIYFTEGKAETDLQGRETSLLTKNILIAVPLSKVPKPANNFEVFLNGFDLYAETAADKIQFLRLEIKDADAFTHADTFFCPARVAIVFNCQSLECPEFKAEYTYHLALYWLFAASSNNLAVCSNENLTTEYSWNEDQEIFPKTKNEALKGVELPVYSNAGVGIRSFSISLDKALWLLQLNTAIKQQTYSSSKGEAFITTNLFYKEWSAAMNKSDVAPYESKFSLRRKGWAVLDLQTALLQFQNGQAKTSTVTGTMFWAGKNAKPDTQEAISVKSIR